MATDVFIGSNLSSSQMQACCRDRSQRGGIAE
jgi:hypothetical protein